MQCSETCCQPGEAGLAFELEPLVAAPLDEGPRSDTSTVLVCSSVQDWLLEECDAYRCMHVPRPLAWGDVQQHVDILASAGPFGRQEILSETVKVAGAGGYAPQIAAKFSDKARRLVRKVPGPGLPEGLSEQIHLDIVEVGTALAQMLPDAEEVIVKLEVFGEKCCSRWHRDNYTCRAIITYNGPGTEYVEHENVNFWELANCGNNDHIIRDKTQILSANAADILLMKGELFPGSAKGLVHKSPDRRYDADGTIMSRLCLKLDVD